MKKIIIILVLLLVITTGCSGQKAKTEQEYNSVQELANKYNDGSNFNYSETNADFTLTISSDDNQKTLNVEKKNNKTGTTEQYAITKDDTDGSKVDYNSLNDLIKNNFVVSAEAFTPKLLKKYYKNDSTFSEVAVKVTDQEYLQYSSVDTNTSKIVLKKVNVKDDKVSNYSDDIIVIEIKK